MSLATALNIAFVAFAIVGNEFIRRRDARGWYFWIASNTLAILYFCAVREDWTLALFAYYLVASFLGLRRWEREERRSRAARILPYHDAYALYRIPTWQRMRHGTSGARGGVRHGRTVLGPCAGRVCV